ncbi:hypothetical protein PAEPH01_0402 [Pancytospora epiphaga]|nr:hypothetical protein PAEPH01_0402 [Pancytospora epiphaga]
MESAVKELAKNADGDDTQHILRIMDNILYYSEKLSNEEAASYSLDLLIKRVLKRNRCVEIIEKIGDLLFLVRDPRNFQDELFEVSSQKTLTLPLLMLIFQISQDFDFNYRPFYQQLIEILTLDNVQSKGFLIFLINTLESRSVEREVVGHILHKLSRHSVLVKSSSVTHIVYAMLVIMRMHPATFNMVKELKELALLSYSFVPIKNIINRIFIESEYPLQRPKTVFLQNFVFPELDS